MMGLGGLARALVGLTGVLTLATIVTGRAQVPIVQEPRHRPVFENAVVRVLDVNVPAGDTTLDHIHDHDVVTVSISASETRTRPVGKPWGDVRPKRAPGGASVTEYADRPEAHRVENLGKGLFRLIAIENVRRRGWSSGPAVTGPATTPSTESRAFRAYDIRLSGSADRTSHRHEAPVLAVLVQGSVVANPVANPAASPVASAAVRGMGASGTGSEGRSTFAAPGQVFFVPAGTAHSLARVDGRDAYVVEIEVR
jgi:hypothetical protein